MKKRICYLALACISMLLSACGDEVEGRIDVDDSAPAQVTNVSARGTAGAVQKELARRSPRHRKGHRPLPHDILADLPHGARS